MSFRSKLKKLLTVVSKFSSIVSTVAFLLVIIDLGFSQEKNWERVFFISYFVTIITGIISLVLSLFVIKNIRVIVVDILLLLFLFFVIFYDYIHIQTGSLSGIFNYWTYLALIAIFVREINRNQFRLTYKTMNPAQLFVISFLFIILVGSLLLMLPNASNGKISYIDALFTSTSAVCVTGLTALDTATFFTPLGQAIILVLIQIGGLGIMTFASYFSYFFKSGSSYDSQMYMGEMTNVDKLSDVFSTLKKIILVTFSIEAFGALLIFESISPRLIPDAGNRIFFAVFHAVSGFCNAGFSTMTNNLYEYPVRFNYFFQLVVAMMIVFGGLGFPIIFNIWKYTIYKITNLIKRIFKKRRDVYLPWVLNLNSKIIISTTAILITGGALSFFIFEYNNTLAEHHSLIGKISVSIFGSITPRTAGFNSVDTAKMALPTTLLFLVLMWIGASPASTGGGIKTSTFAIAVLNFVKLAKGQKRMEVFGREISQLSLNRAFAIIVLSFLVLFISIFGVASFDSGKGLLNITFECISAFGTVGLSRGITAALSEPSKIILIITMFIGRVGMLTLLMALLKKTQNTKYLYPTEEILIN